MLRKIHEVCPAKPCRSGGFTLIELIISISILLIMSMGIIVNYNSYTDSERVRQSGFTLKSDLRLVASKVNSGVKVKTSDCATLVGCDVSFSNSCAGGQSCYTTTLICSNPAFSQVQTTANLQKNVTFQPVPSTIRFLPLSAGTNLAADSEITLSGINTTYHVKVTQSGTISDY